MILHASNFPTFQDLNLLSVISHASYFPAYQEQYESVGLEGGEGYLQPVDCCRFQTVHQHHRHARPICHKASGPRLPLRL